MKNSSRYRGCILCGAIGDAYGSSYENNITKDDSDTFYPFGRPEELTKKWIITDDTQLTLATSEVILENELYSAEDFAKTYLKYFENNKITGVGASTLKALTELQVGGHWSQVGRRGEFAAGNGAAMRIAPLAFVNGFSREQLREVCTITHNNDEAYVGALAVFLSIKAVIESEWTGEENLIKIIIDKIPDTRVRDRLIDIKDIEDLSKIGLKGNDGYVVNSVPLAIAAANQIKKLGLETVFNQLIQIGGDTDTNCSIAGQIAGALIGKDEIPITLLNKLSQLKDYKWIDTTINKFVKKIKSQHI